MHSAPHTVIIGNGMVGHRLVETLKARAPHLPVTVITEEPRLAYDRVHLSSHFDEPRPELALATEAGYAELGVNVAYGRAHSVDRAARTVTVGDRLIPYDTLVFATGSVPFVPPVPGRDAAGCFVYRTIEDLDAIQAAARSARTGVVIGGGLLGLEAAGALRKLGLATHVIEFAPHLMPAQIDPEGGALLRGLIEAMGIAVHVSTATRAIVAGPDGRAQALEFDGAEPLAAELVVFSAGIRPRDDLARACGLAVGERGGIVIDDACRTSDPHILAIGECALHGGRVYGLVAPGHHMARAAADSILGGDTRFAGADLSTKLKLLGVDVASFGDAKGVTPNARTVSLTDHVRGAYKKLVLSEDGARVLGGVLVGDTAAYEDLLDRVRSATPITGAPEALIVPPQPGAPVPAVADALICSCEQVRASTLHRAVCGGAHTVGALKACTGAGTGCGGCVPRMNDLLAQERTRLGQTVDRRLCEHYPYSRQELFDLIRVHGHRDWNAVLAAHGAGHGCEVCKPAVASILASLHGEYILNPQHAPLQDTNDAYLANIQKNGTYSVVPRVPGGEITPERLIVLGEVAKKYRLYCKITGGQRIDLLGAHLDDLPAIWSELVAAGFESGHAYGKGLRTVKSCVGSTWCRYGVQDSTSLAVRLELRYRGLRSPHKLKAGVSGCVRECAEARGKDFGVIATERGWNLYVCGNGGATPAHAQLLASDLDEDTLIRYLDRFLMYYIRTADRLQRTSTWLERLDGGLEYLKAVIVEDRLGLAAELEAAMQAHVRHHHDEWAATLADPRSLARFRSFVNTDEPDSGIQWVEERGQPRPAPFDDLTPLHLAATD